MIIKVGSERFKVKKCKTFISQILGLMFSGKKNLLFEFKNERVINLHMFFVFFPIDIIFVNKELQVIKKVRAYPFQPFVRGVKSKYILELVNKNKINKEDKLKFS
jgi:uncharacterized protein